MIDDPEFKALSNAIHALAERLGSRACAIIVVAEDDVASYVAGCDCDGCLGAMTRALADGTENGGLLGPHDCGTGGAVH